jgi:electron transport complex protein RnfG
MPYRQSLVRDVATNATTDYKPVAMAALVLAVSALVGTALLSLTASHSVPLIEANKRQALLDNLGAVIPRDTFDNDIATDTLLVADTDHLAGAEPVRVFRARSGGAPVAVAFQRIAHDGYNGDIVLLMGVSLRGEITGVRVIEHRETPGLGDAIEARRSDWIEGFVGRSLWDPAASGWRVKKDGGEFDQFTGATITPRAIVNAVRQGLAFYERHRGTFFVIDAVGNGATP